MYCLCIGISLLFGLITGQSLTPPNGQRFEPDMDGRMTLPCTASAWPTRVATIDWKKRQDSTDNTAKAWVTIATNGRVEAHFTGNGYSTELTYPPDGSVVASLVISGFGPEDIGEYRCQLHEGSTLLDEVIHTAVMYQEVDSVTLYKSPNETVTDAKLTYKADTNAEQYFGCEVIGGYPKPHVRIVVGEGDEAIPIGGLTASDFSTVEGETKGLQRFKYRTRDFSERFPVQANFDGKAIHCIARVKDSQSDQDPSTKQATAVLTISYKPRFEIERDFSAQPGDKNVVLAVGVYANPMIQRTVWKGKVNLVEVDSADKINNPSGMTTAREIQGDLIIEKLNISKVDMDHFQTYDVTVYNSVGQDSTTVLLKRGPRDDYKEGGLNNTGGATQGAQSILPNVAALVVPLLLAMLVSAYLH